MWVFCLVYIFVKWDKKKRKKEKQTQKEREREREIFEVEIEWKQRVTEIQGSS